MSRLITPKKNLDGMMSNMQRVFDVCQTPGPKKAAEIRRPVDRQVAAKPQPKGSPRNVSKSARRSISQIINTQNGNSAKQFTL
jgi:hypothetical protein